MKAQAAGEQAIAVGVVDHHAGPDAGHRHRPGHQLGPRVEVGLGVTDDRGLAVGAARRVHAHDLLAGNREQPERIALAQVVLDEERDLAQVLERGDVARLGDAGPGEALGAQRLSFQDAGDGGPQALELEAPELVARQGLDAIPDRRVVRGGGGQRSSAPRGCARAPG